MSEIRKEEEQILSELKDDDLSFPMYLSWTGGIIETVGRIIDAFDIIGSDKKDVSMLKTEDGEDRYVEGKGYVHDGIVYQYHKKKPERVTSPVPYFYITVKTKKNGDFTEQLVTKHPLPFEETVSKFGIRNLVDYSYSRMLDETTGNEVLYDEDMINDMTAARSRFVPEVYKDDDCLKKIIKYAIIEKDVDINKYKSAMDTSYALTNMKSALISKTKMSITYFLMWVELLGIDFSILIDDNKTDAQNPLKEHIVYRSKDNSVYKYDPSKFMVNLTKRVEAAAQRKFENEHLIQLFDVDRPSTKEDAPETTGDNK